MMGWGDGCEFSGMESGHMGGWRMAGPFLGLLLVLGLIALVVFAAVSLARRRRVTPSGASLAGQPSALDVAQRRLAAGEITPDEYHKIREALNT